MVVRRIKDRWHNSTPENTTRQVLNEKTLDDQASALAFIQWRTALNSAINLHAEDFRYDNDQQRVGVIIEYLAFQLQITDRLSAEFIEDKEREALIVAACKKSVDQIQENLRDIAGPGAYLAPFIELLNRRFAEYSVFGYTDGRPGFEAMRFLGHNVLMLLGEDQTNRWVIDHVMEIDGPAIVDQNVKSLNRLFGRV